MISMGAQGGEASFVKILVHAFGRSIHLTFSALMLPLKVIYFAFNVLYGIAMMNFLTATWLLRSF